MIRGVGGVGLREGDNIVSGSLQVDSVFWDMNVIFFRVAILIILQSTSSSRFLYL